MMKFDFSIYKNILKIWHFLCHVFLHYKKLLEHILGLLLQSPSNNLKCFVCLHRLVSTEDSKQVQLPVDLKLVSMGNLKRVEPSMWKTEPEICSTGFQNLSRWPNSLFPGSFLSADFRLKERPGYFFSDQLELRIQKCFQVGRETLRRRSGARSCRLMFWKQKFDSILCKNWKPVEMQSLWVYHVKPGLNKIYNENCRSVFGFHIFYTKFLLNQMIRWFLWIWPYVDSLQQMCRQFHPLPSPMIDVLKNTQSVTKLLW